jgi:hypothetical protein
MNNRLKVEIGGKVSSGSNDYSGQSNSFFDNVTMEYRLNQNATQNVKVFFQQNVYDWLEGYTSMYGAGFVWRRTVSSFSDLIHFRSGRTKMPQRPINSGNPMKGIPGDSLKTKENEAK